MRVNIVVESILESSTQKRTRRRVVPAVLVDQQQQTDVSNHIR